MNMKEQAQKYYKGKLTFFDNAEEQVEILEKEKWLMDRNPFGDGYTTPVKENEFAILDDVNTLKNVMAFAEITRFREIQIVDMTQEERQNITQVIIDNLNKFHIEPIGYEITKSSIIVGWYLNSVINTFTFSDQIGGVVDYSKGQSASYE